MYKYRRLFIDFLDCTVATPPAAFRYLITKIRIDSQPLTVTMLKELNQYSFQL